MCQQHLAIDQLSFNNNFSGHLRRYGRGGRGNGNNLLPKDLLFPFPRLNLYSPPGKDWESPLTPIADLYISHLTQSYPSIWLSPICEPILFKLVTDKASCSTWHICQHKHSWCEDTIWKPIFPSHWIT